MTLHPDVGYLPGQEAAGSSEIFLDRREGPQRSTFNYTTSTIIGDQRRDAEVHNAPLRPRAKDDRVHCSQARFSEHDAVDEQIVGHEGSTPWQSSVTTGSSTTVVRSRMARKCCRCWRRSPHPYGPRSRNKYSSRLT